MIMRQRVNEAAEAVMVAHALAADLDQLGVNNGVARLSVLHRLRHYGRGGE